jgi:serralysin
LTLFSRHCSFTDSALDEAPDWDTAHTRELEGNAFMIISDPNRGLDPYAGNTYRGTYSTGYDPKQILNLAGVVQHIDSGTRLPVGEDGIVTYGFFTGEHAVGINNNPHFFGEGSGYAPFTEIQKAAAAEAIGLWDDLVPLTFVNVGDVGAKNWAQNDATILLANTTTGPAQAWTYYPGSDQGYQRFSSDVWTNDPQANGSNGWLDFGGYGMTTLVHELGHSIGLSHPGAYNFGPGFAVTYGNGAEYAQDSKQYSIMSYWSDRETNALVTTWNVFLAGQPQTPMVHDIYTIQQIYGADTTTRATDTVYGFNSTAGRDVFDFTKNPYPMLSIYDAGGNDTIDLSGFTAGQFVDLHAGSFSSIGGAPASLAQTNADRAQWNADSDSQPGDPYYLAPESQADYNNLVSTRLPIIEGRITATTGVSGISATEFSNFSIAYGTTVENATGGSARDLLWGNAVANVLKGMGGNDVIDGYEGADTYIGGSGNDTFAFHNLENGDHIVDFASGDKIDVGKIDANSLMGGDQAFKFIGDHAFGNHAGELRYDGTTVYGDVNGDGAADFSIVIDNHATLAKADFIL